MKKRKLTTEEAMKILNSEFNNNKNMTPKEIIKILDFEQNNKMTPREAAAILQAKEASTFNLYAKIGAEKTAQKKAEQLAINESVQREKEAKNLALAEEHRKLWEQKIAKRDQEILDKKNTEMDNICNQSTSYETPKNEGILAFVEVLPIGLDVVELWYDKEEKAGITILVNNHYEHYFIASNAFKDMICSHSLKTNNKVLSKYKLSEILDTLSSICKYYGVLCTSNLRIAENNGKTYIDLVNDKWEAIEIDECGWRIVNPKHVKFIRTRNMLPQCTPERGGNIEELKQFINFEKNEDFILLVGFILKCLDPHSPYPVLSLIGQQGSGKSETSQMIISLVSPSNVPMRSMPSSEQNLLIAAQNNHIFAIDNISTISIKQSDWLCRLSTVAGFSSRTLFTNNEESTMFVSRPLILNGISDIINRPDLIDRTLVINLPQITEEKRRAKQFLWKEFINNKPRILGALCDGLSRAIRYVDLVNLTRIPRMTDFTKFVTAAEVAFKWEYETFLRAYIENIDESSHNNLSSNPLALAIFKQMQYFDTLKLTAIGWINELKNLSRRELYLKYIPVHPNKFSEELMRIVPLLQKEGITVNRIKSNGERFIEIKNTKHQR